MAAAILLPEAVNRQLFEFLTGGVLCHRYALHSGGLLSKFKTRIFHTAKLLR
jgi:hypothetical protein